MEALALAGAFDGLDSLNRSQYFASSDNESNFLEALLKYGNKIQNDNQTSMFNLFGGATTIEIKKPDIPICEEWNQLEKLNKEKELIGIYLSSHPLDQYKLEIQTYCNTALVDFQDIQQLNGKDIKVSGMVTLVEHKTTKTGNPFGSITIEDFTDSYRITFFSKEYIEYKKFFTVGYPLLLRGKVAPRFGDQKELEFKPTSIDLLSEMRQKMIQSIAIKVPIDKISEDLINEIQLIAEQNKGNSELKFIIFDPPTKVWVQMASRSHRVQVSNELIDYLQNRSDLEYKVY